MSLDKIKWLQMINVNRYCRYLSLDIVDIRYPWTKFAVFWYQQSFYPSLSRTCQWLPRHQDTSRGSLILINNVAANVESWCQCWKIKVGGAAWKHDTLTTSCAVSVHSVHCRCPVLGLRMFTCLLQRLTLDIVTEDIYHLTSIATHSLGTFLKFRLDMARRKSTIVP